MAACLSFVAKGRLADGSACDRCQMPCLCLHPDRHWELIVVGRTAQQSSWAVYLQSTCGIYRCSLGLKVKSISFGHSRPVACPITSKVDSTAVDFQTWQGIRFVLLTLQYRIDIHATC